MIVNEIVSFLMDHVWILACAIGLTGYLIGSVSTARLIYFLVTGSKRFEPFKESIPHTDEKFESDLISATWITMKLGKRYGCITSILDMLKVALPTLIIKLVFPTYPFFLLIAISGILGHNYPIYYRFKGGRGESPILGALFVINWFGILIANGIASILGYFFGSILVLRWGGYIILIFWFWYYFQDPYYVLFMIMANILYWTSMWSDLARFQQLKKEKGLKFSEAEVSEFLLMGKSPGRFLDKYGLYFLFKRWFRSSK
jgi:glycerol-3-phosphate acyltransferase PlsY